MFTTNSLVSRMLTKVAFRVTPCERGRKVIDRTGGYRARTVKNDIGAMSPTPMVERVLTTRSRAATHGQSVASSFTGLKVDGVDDHFYVHADLSRQPGQRLGQGARRAAGARPRREYLVRT